MTTTPDFRAELQRLVDLYEALGGNWSPHGYTDTWNDALANARIALATSPPEPPTQADLLRLWRFNFAKTPLDRFMDIARAVLALKDTPPRELPDHWNLIGFAFGREPWRTWLQPGGRLESAHRELSDLMLAVLAHWGRPATPPPEPPTDEDLNRLCYSEFSTSTGHGERVDVLGFVRAALERWGQR